MNEVKKKDSGALGERVLTAVILAPLVLAAILYLPTPWLALGIGVVFSLGLIEWARLIGLTPSINQALLVAVNIGLMAWVWIAHSDNLNRTDIAIGATWWLLLAPLWLIRFEFAAAPSSRNRWLKAIAATISVVPAWIAAVVLHGSSPRGPEWLLFVLLLVWCADTAAYFAGRRFGRTKLAPKISPGKTRAGAYGALIGCAAFATLGGWWLNHEGQTLVALILLSLITVMYSIVGDLFESLLKRHSNVKDSGSLFPGHGGVLDRCDSLFAALPVFTAGKILIGL